MIPFLVLWAQDIYGFASCAAHPNGVGAPGVSNIPTITRIVIVKCLVGEFQPEG